MWTNQFLFDTQNDYVIAVVRLSLEYGKASFPFAILYKLGRDLKYGYTMDTIIRMPNIKYQT